MSSCGKIPKVIFGLKVIIHGSEMFIDLKHVLNFAGNDVNERNQPGNEDVEDKSMEDYDEFVEQKSAKKQPDHESTVKIETVK